MAFAGMHRRSVRRYVPEGYGDWLDYREEIYSLGPMRLPAGRRAAFMALLEVRRIVDYARRHSGRRQ